MSSIQANNPDHGYIPFKSQDFYVSIQKKLFGKVTNKIVLKTLIDHEWTRLMDNFHRLYKSYCKQWTPSITQWFNDSSNICPKKVADKLLKCLIKIIIKVTILIINQQLNEEEINNAFQIQQRIRSILMTIVSFHQLDFSYDRTYLTDQMNICRNSLKQLITGHLSIKSLNRVDFFFDILSEPTFLDRFFNTTESNDSFYEMKISIIDNINHLLERKHW